MIRHSMHLLALGAAAVLAAGEPAAAGSCCGCPTPCATEPVVEFVEAREPAPFYVVDQGPVFTGPGIVSFPTTHTHYQSIADYPYIGPSRHRHWHHPEVVLWQQSRVAYVDVKAPHRLMHAAPRVVPYRSSPRRPMRPPLQPADK